MRGIWVCVVASAAALALAIAPAGAGAATPVLEFVVPGGAFPVAFTASGGGVTAELTGFETVVVCFGSRGAGMITGPRSALSNYVFTGCGTAGGADGGERCKSAGAEEEEIRSQAMEANLVYIDQSRNDVAMLLNPQGGVYMSFECGGEAVEASGPFLSRVGPINEEATSFQAVLSRSGAMQTPDEYEAALGEKRLAIPMGKRGTHAAGTTGVSLAFTVQTSVPLEIKAFNVFEVSAQEQADKGFAEAEAKRHQEKEAAAAKQRQEEEATAAAEKKLREEQQAKAERLRHHRLLSRALGQCRKADSKQQRVSCEKRAKRRYQARPAVYAAVLAR
jgi:hypothetical protein